MSLRRNCIYSWQLRVQGLNADFIMTKILHDSTSSNRKTSLVCISVWTRGFDHSYGSLHKNVFEGRTSTWSGAFSLLICLDANKFVLLSFFSLMKTIYPRVSTKPPPNDAKSSLPVVAPYFITFTSNQTSNSKREFVPRDQVSAFLVVYCSLFLHIMEYFHLILLSTRIVLSCFYTFIFYFKKLSTRIWRLPFAVYTWSLRLSIPFLTRRHCRRLYPEHRFLSPILHPMQRLSKSCQEVLRFPESRSLSRSRWLMSFQSLLYCGHLWKLKTRLLMLNSENCKSKNYFVSALCTS